LGKNLFYWEKICFILGKKFDFFGKNPIFWDLLKTREKLKKVERVENFEKTKSLIFSL
jgi:hypothetical protein